MLGELFRHNCWKWRIKKKNPSETITYQRTTIGISRSSVSSMAKNTSIYKTELTIGEERSVLSWEQEM